MQKAHSHNFDEELQSDDNGVKLETIQSENEILLSVASEIFDQPLNLEIIAILREQNCIGTPDELFIYLHNEAHKQFRTHNHCTDEDTFISQFKTQLLCLSNHPLSKNQNKNNRNCLVVKSLNVVYCFRALMKQKDIERYVPHSDFPCLYVEFWDNIKLCKINLSLADFKRDYAYLLNYRHATIIRHMKAKANGNYDELPSDYKYFLRRLNNASSSIIYENLIGYDKLGVINYIPTEPDSDYPWIYYVPETISTKNLVTLKDLTIAKKK